MSAGRRSDEPVAVISKATTPAQRVFVSSLGEIAAACPEVETPAIVVVGKTLVIRGNRHVRYPKGTPLSNLMLGITDRYGVNLNKFGNSNAAIDLTTL